MGLFDWVGDVLGIGGGDVTVNAPTTPAPTETETAIQQEILKLLQTEKEPTKLDQMWDQYGEAVLKQAIDALPMSAEYQQMAYDLMKEQYDYYKSPEYQKQKELSLALTEYQLNAIQAAKGLGEITGDLSDQEMESLNTMESNAVTTLTETINREHKEVFETLMTQLVDRGVLQGSVGAQAIADVRKRADELITSGTRDIVTAKMSNILGLQESKRNWQLNLQDLVQRGVISGEQAVNQWAQSGISSATGQQNISQQLSQAAQQYAGQLTTQWDTSKLSGAISQWGSMAGMRASEATNALNAAIAQAQARASETASKWGAVGNIAGLASSAYIMKK